MQFKIKNTSYELSFTFLALILFIMTISKSRAICILLFSAILHEMVHLFFIYLFSVPPEKVSFTILGADIKRAITASYNYNSEIIINASAPVFNISAGAVFYLLSALNTDYVVIFKEISEANIVLGLFNLIPYYTFDGGNVLKYILLKHFTSKITEKILTIVSLTVTVAFSFVSIHIFLNYRHNFSLFIICAYMFLSIIFKKQNSLDY